MNIKIWTFPFYPPQERKTHFTKIFAPSQEKQQQTHTLPCFLFIFQPSFNSKGWGWGEETQNTRRERSPQFLNFGYASHKTHNSKQEMEEKKEREK